jgi:ABC-2 type transport system permease protein
MNGVWALVVLALRRDRILLPAWLVGLTAMVGFSVSATKDLYGSTQDLVSASETINATAALVALYGKVYDPASLGAISLIKLTAFGAALIAVLFVFITVRHTRTEEEAGRLELISAGVVGRYAPLSAALIVGFGASALLGLLTTAALTASGLGWAGGVSFGLGWAMSGVVFTTVAGITAQLTVSPRTAVGLGMAVIGLAYVMRAVGDLAAADPGWLSWLSPIGWSQQIRPFAGDRWWVAGLPLLATVVMVPMAYALRAHRDLGSGLIADRPGPARGRVASVPGLAWRLQRATLAAWVAGAAVMGAVLGSIAHDVSGLLTSPAAQRYFEALGGKQGFTDAFLAAEVRIFGALVAAYAITATARLRGEESSGHLEPVLATPTTRWRFAVSHYLLALLGTTVVLLVIGASIGLAHGIAVGEVGHQVARLTVAALAQVPAAWVFASLVLLLFGWVPRWVVGAWGVLVAAIVAGELGPLWRLPSWVMDLSPFQHSPQLPAAHASTGGLIGLLVATVVLAIVGLARWNTRDVPQ